MPFVKGDPNINRSGRPKNAEPELLRKALAREGAKRGEDFWDKVASYAFTDKNVMVAVVKKFIPDMSSTELSGALEFTQMPTVKKDGKEMELQIGDIGNPADAGYTGEVAPLFDGNQ